MTSNKINTKKTLESLDKHVWPSLNEVPRKYLITNRLRKVLKDNSEDFRILIGASRTEISHTMELGNILRR